MESRQGHVTQSRYEINMNYDKAREMEDHTWNYSRQNDDMIYPIGYCASRGNKENIMHKHSTQQEAEECYKSYVLDTGLNLEASVEGAMFKCKVCATYTNKMATIDGWKLYHLCDEHRNRKTVETLYDCSGLSMHS